VVVCKKGEANDHRLPSANPFGLQSTAVRSGEKVRVDVPKPGVVIEAIQPMGESSSDVKPALTARMCDGAGQTDSILCGVPGKQSLC